MLVPICIPCGVPSGQLFTVCSLLDKLTVILASHSIAEIPLRIIASMEHFLELALQSRNASGLSRKLEWYNSPSISISYYCVVAEAIRRLEPGISDVGILESLQSILDSVRVLRTSILLDDEGIQKYVKLQSFLEQIVIILQEHN